jgi:methylmalonyl-CoA/ethylmalonyl-CoA epimerase
MLETSAELHHVAYVVKDLAASMAVWQTQFGASVELSPTLVTAHGVRVTFLRLGEARIELVQPENEDSVVRETSQMRGRPDHLCFLCDDLESLLRRVRESGGLIVRPPVPSEAFGGRRMCFIFMRDLGLVEWVER